ncbi:MAG: hypothetical protein AYL33_003540 [Candidatus Bathyarchaeota archaeon B63]|nr:MAG: hypothetical protein AYL33_003540 [Candidatus Bathyarchaeota archaeon B63]
MSVKEELLRLLEKDREFRYAVAGLIGLDQILMRLDRHEEELIKLREDMNRGFKRYDEEIAKLREDMNRGFELVERHISALGARWGLLTEEAFRAGLKGLIEEEFGFKIERWRVYDEEGIVFGYPSQVEVDVAVRNEKIMLIEVKAHVDASDLYSFKRKAELYEMKTGRKPSRLLVVTPYIEDRAIQAAKSLKIEVYTKV